MNPQNNQPAKLYGTAKTHKFNNINEFKKEKLKFRPIIDQMEHIPTMQHRLFPIISNL